MLLRVLRGGFKRREIGAVAKRRANDHDQNVRRKDKSDVKRLLGTDNNICNRQGGNHDSGQNERKLGRDRPPAKLYGGKSQLGKRKKEEAYRELKVDDVYRIWYARKSENGGKINAKIADILENEDRKRKEYDRSKSDPYREDRIKKSILKGIALIKGGILRGATFSSLFLGCAGRISRRRGIIRGL